MSAGSSATLEVAASQLVRVSADYLEILRRCGGYYRCPKDDTGKRLGPLVGYAGKYDGEHQWVAHFLNFFAEKAGTMSDQVLAVTAEKEGGDLIFAGGLGQLVKGKKVLEIDDITTTGGSVEKMSKLITKTGGEPIGVGFLWNRGGVKFDIPSYSLVTREFSSYAPTDCPLCKEDVPMSTSAGRAK